MDIVLGIVGAVAGGWLFNAIGHIGVTGVSLYSILVAVIETVIVLFTCYALVGNHAGGLLNGSAIPFLNFGTL